MGYPRDMAHAADGESHATRASEATKVPAGTRTLVAVLAAGRSSRMGAAKLLLPYRDDGTCLLERAWRCAAEAGVGDVTVVTGAFHDEMAPLLARLGATALRNTRWSEGQATSVALAARHAEDAGYDALLLMAADQPFVSPAHLRALVAAFWSERDPACEQTHGEAGSSAGAPVACRSASNGRRGNPCVFPRSAFGLLEGLTGDEGARQLFASRAIRPHDVALDAPREGDLFFDVDSPDELAVLRAHARRADFPILEREAGGAGEPLCYLDGAATALVPEPVRARVDETLARHRANVHRGAHLLAEEATDAYESAREHAARFLGADPGQTVFTHGTTESMNLVARCWAESRLGAGDVVVLTEEAHHAAIVPFQMLAERTGVDLRFVRVDGDGVLRRDSWEEALAASPRLVVLTHTSNVLGFRQPDFWRMAAEARDCGALVAVDAAQAAGHVPFSIAGAPFDFVAFSGHKLGGLTGLGILWCSSRALGQMRPCLGGGGMIERVSIKGYTPTEAPWAFEPGTPAIEAAASLDAALGYLEAFGLESVERLGRLLCARAVAGLRGIEGTRILGDQGLARTSLVSFTLDGVHPHDLSAALSDRGIMVRAGHHCAMPLHAALGVRASVRASFGPWSTPGDVDRLIEAVRDVASGTR